MRFSEGVRRLGRGVQTFSEGVRMLGKGVMTFLKGGRRLGKGVFDGIRNEKFKHNLLQAIPFWIASLLTGLVAVLYTRLFAFAERGTSFVIDHHEWLLFVISPVCFVLAWWLVSR